MQNKNADPIGTLSVGNVVSASVTLYKSNFRDYFQVSLRATGWIFLLFAAIIPLTIIVAMTQQPFLAVPLGIAWIIFACFCSAKYGLNRAIISRLAYQQLINQPETVQQTTKILTPSQWRLFRLAIWLGLFVMGVALLAYLILGIAIGIGIAIGTQLPSPLNFLLPGILILGAAIAAIWLVLRAYSEWFVAELPLAIEGTNGEITPLESIGRSRRLTTFFVGRVQLIILVAFLMTLPVTMMANVPGVALSAVEPTSNNSLNPYFFLVQGISILMSLIVELFVMSFWQAVKAVIYFDLRSRREGADLQMRRP